MLQAREYVECWTYIKKGDRNALQTISGYRHYLNTSLLICNNSNRSPLASFAIHHYSNCLHCHEWSLYKVSVFSACLCKNKTSTQCISTTTTTATLHCPHPLFLAIPFVLAENQSSKWIAPTNIMQPKSDNEYTCHQWLRVQVYLYFCSYFNCVL